MSGDVKGFKILSEKNSVENGIFTVVWNIESEENIACEEKLDVFY